MVLAHITKTGNLSIPKIWRDELGIEPNSDVIIELINERIIIEPLKKNTLKEVFTSIDKEIKQKRITFSRADAIRDELYD